MMKLRLCLVEALIILAGASASASVMRAMDLAELTASADHVVLGEVLSTESAWDAKHRTIFSTVEIAVAESWKGPVPGTGRIRLRQFGGVVGDIEMTVYGEARFQQGERVVVFTQGDHLVGMGQGKRRLSWDGATKRWMAAPWDRAGASLAGKAAGSSERAVSLETLRAQVRALVGP
jgi:hypothetical protein